jgi:hypothetical protein
MEVDCWWFTTPCADADRVSRSDLSFHSRCYLCDMKVAPPDRCIPAARIKLTKSADQERHRHAAYFLVRSSLLGRRFSGLRCEGYAQGPQGVHRVVPHRRSRVEAAQIHCRAIRPRHASSSPRGGAEGVRSKARRAGSGRPPDVPTAIHTSCGKARKAQALMPSGSQSR